MWAGHHHHSILQCRLPANTLRWLPLRACSGIILLHASRPLYSYYTQPINLSVFVLTLTAMPSLMCLQVGETSLVNVIDYSDPENPALLKTFEIAQTGTDIEVCDGVVAVGMVGEETSDPGTVSIAAVLFYLLA